MRLADRWGTAALRFGYTAVPNLLLRWNGLQTDEPIKRLTSTEILILVLITSYWIDSRPLPFPGIKSMSLYSGLSERHVRRVIKELGRKGVIRVVKNQGGYDDRRNFYDLSPLIKILTEVSLKLQVEVDQHRWLKPTKLELAEAVGLVGDE